MFKKNIKIIVGFVIIIIAIVLIAYQKITIDFQKGEYDTRKVGSNNKCRIDIVEDGESLDILNGKDFFANIILSEADNKIKVGKKYTKHVSIKNIGEMDVYTRFMISKKWLDQDGNEQTDASADTIEVQLSNNGWFIDESSSTPDRIVVYYPKIVKAGETIPFMESIKINEEINKIAKEERIDGAEGTTIYTERVYDNCKVNIEINVDAIQTHEAVYAIKNTWGVDVNIDENGNLSLK